MTNTMTYKGYIARVEYDPRDDIFVGRVLGIEDRVTFHGATVAMLPPSHEATRPECLRTTAGTRCHHAIFLWRADYSMCCREPLG